MKLQIDAGNFIACVEIGVLAAPIIQYMEKWSESQIKQYCFWKGWKVSAATNANEGTSPVRNRHVWTSSDGTEVFSGGNIE